jgi:Protein of unknown function (DUF2835)
MRKYRFRLAISASKYLAYYEGAADHVLVTLANGQKMQFPADILRPFVSHEGIYGEFVLRVNAENKLEDIQRVGD